MPSTSRTPSDAFACSSLGHSALEETESRIEDAIKNLKQKDQAFQLSQELWHLLDETLKLNPESEAGVDRVQKRIVSLLSAVTDKKQTIPTFFFQTYLHYGLTGDDATCRVVTIQLNHYTEFFHESEKEIKEVILALYERTLTPPLAGGEVFALQALRKIVVKDDLPVKLLDQLSDRVRNEKYTTLAIHAFFVIAEAAYRFRRTQFISEINKQILLDVFNGTLLNDLNLKYRLWAAMGFICHSEDEQLLKSILFRSEHFYMDETLALEIRNNAVCLMKGCQHKLKFKYELSPLTYEGMARQVLNEESQQIRNACFTILVNGIKAGHPISETCFFYVEKILKVANTDDILPSLHRLLKDSNRSLTENSLELICAFFEEKEKKESARCLAIEIIAYTARNNRHLLSTSVLLALEKVIEEQVPVLSNACFTALFYHVSHIESGKSLYSRLLTLVYKALLLPEMTVEAMRVYKRVVENSESQEKEKLLKKLMDIAQAVLAINQTSEALALIAEASSHFPEAAQRQSARRHYEMDKEDPTSPYSLVPLMAMPSEEKSFEAILLELQDSHPDKDFSFLESDYRAVKAASQQDGQLHAIGEPIFKWTKANCRTWAQSVKEQPERACDQAFFPELLAAVSRGYALFSGYEPRTIQKVALLLFFYPSEQGLLAQMATGEGKSLVIAMFAALHVLRGEQPEIVTSASPLARRDAEKHANFFSIFNMTVEDNGDDKRERKRGLKPCYLADVVYGGIEHFQWDLLSDIKGEGTRGGRPCRIVMADEVDSMAVDEGDKVAIEGNHISGMEHLERLLAAVWIEQLRLNPDKDMPHKDLRILLSTYLTELITSPHAPIRFPQYLKPFALFQIEAWVKAAIQARETLTCGKDYVDTPDEANDLMISPVDYHNTGVTRMHTQWNNGIHQFLQIKHLFKMTLESLHASYLSNMAFFKKYQRVYGMTGTLGPLESRELLSKMYDVNLIFIPTYKRKRFIELPAVIAVDEEAWYQEIELAIKREIGRGRPVLVICECINQVILLKAFLKECGIEELKLYSRSDNEESLVVDEPIKPGEIILATHLAGRGTDIITTQEVETYGGLAVIDTGLAINKRNEDQVFGRTSRRGQFGTGQLILNWTVIQPQLQIQDNAIEAVRLARDQIEQSRLLTIRKYGVKRIELRDALFKQFCELNLQLKAMDENEHKLKDIEERWAFWLKQRENRFKTNKHVNQEEILAEFEQFKQTILEEYPHLQMQNPCHWIRYGNELTQNIIINNNRLIKMENERVAQENARIRAENARITQENESARINHEQTRKQQQITDIVTLAVGHGGGHVVIQTYLSEGVVVGEQTTEYNRSKEVIAQSTRGIITTQQSHGPTYISLHSEAVFSVQLENYQAAIAAYTKAIEIEPIFSAHAYYNRACAKILEKASGYKTSALHDLNMAKHHIETTYIPQWQKMQFLIAQQEASGTENALFHQIQTKIQLLSLQVKFIHHAIEVLQKSSEEVMPGSHQFKAFFEGSLPRSEIAELQSSGLYYLFHLEELPDEESDWFDSLCCGFLGGVQMALGVVLSPVNPFLGGVVFSQGFSDAVHALHTWVDGKFDWKQYGNAKLDGLVIDAGIELFTFAKEAVKKSLARGVSQTTAKKIVEEPIKHTFMSLLKKEIINYGINEIMRRGVHQLVKCTLKEFRERIANAIREELTQGLNEDEVKNSVNLILSADIQGDQAPLQELHKLVSDLIRPKIRRVKGIMGAIFRGVMGRESRVLGELIKLIDIHQAISKMTALCDEFCREFKTRAKFIAACLPSSTPLADELKLSDRRKQLYKEITDKIVQRIMEQLQDDVLKPVIDSILQNSIQDLKQQAHAFVEKAQPAQTSDPAVVDFTLAAIAAPQPQQTSNALALIPLGNESNPIDPRLQHWQKAAASYPKWRDRMTEVWLEPNASDSAIIPRNRFDIPLETRPDYWMSQYRDERSYSEIAISSLPKALNNVWSQIKQDPLILRAPYLSKTFWDCVTKTLRFSADGYALTFLPKKSKSYQAAENRMRERAEEAKLLMLYLQHAPTRELFEHGCVMAWENKLYGLRLPLAPRQSTPHNRVETLSAPFLETEYINGRWYVAGCVPDTRKAERATRGPINTKETVALMERAEAVALMQRAARNQGSPASPMMERSVVKFPTTPKYQYQSRVVSGMLDVIRKRDTSKASLHFLSRSYLAPYTGITYPQTPILKGNWNFMRVCFNDERSVEPSEFRPSEMVKWSSNPRPYEVIMQRGKAKADQSGLTAITAFERNLMRSAGPHSLFGLSNTDFHYPDSVGAARRIGKTDIRRLLTKTFLLKVKLKLLEQKVNPFAKSMWSDSMDAVALTQGSEVKDVTSLIPTKNQHAMIEQYIHQSIKAFLPTYEPGDGQIFFRGERPHQLTPEDRFNNGMLPSGNHLDIDEHARGETESSGYISMTTDWMMARIFAPEAENQRGYVYVIAHPEGAISTQEYFEPNSGCGLNWGDEAEWLAPSISPENIIGVFEVAGKALTNFKPNPNYAPFDQKRSWSEYCEWKRFLPDEHQHLFTYTTPEAWMFSQERKAFFLEKLCFSEYRDWECSLPKDHPHFQGEVSPPTAQAWLASEERKQFLAQKLRLRRHHPDYQDNTIKSALYRASTFYEQGADLEIEVNDCYWASVSYNELMRFQDDECNSPAFIAFIRSRVEPTYGKRIDITKIEITYSSVPIISSDVENFYTGIIDLQQSEIKEKVTQQIQSLLEEKQPALRAFIHQLRNMEEVGGRSLLSLNFPSCQLSPLLEQLPCEEIEKNVKVFVINEHSRILCKTLEVETALNVVKALDLFSSLHLKHSQIPNVLGIEIVKFDMHGLTVNLYLRFLPGRSLSWYVEQIARAEGNDRKLALAAAQQAFHALGQGMRELHEHVIPFSQRRASEMQNRLSNFLILNQKDAKKQFGPYFTLTARKARMLSRTVQTQALSIVHDDGHLENLLYDPKQGFSMIDLGADDAYPSDIPFNDFARVLTDLTTEQPHIPELRLLQASLEQGYGLTAHFEPERYAFFRLNSLLNTLDNNYPSIGRHIKRLMELGLVTPEELMTSYEGAYIQVARLLVEISSIKKHIKLIHSASSPHSQDFHQAWLKERQAIQEVTHYVKHALESKLEKLVTRYLLPDSLAALKPRPVTNTLRSTLRIALESTASSIVLAELARNLIYLEEDSVGARRVLTEKAKKALLKRIPRLFKATLEQVTDYFTTVLAPSNRIMHQPIKYIDLEQALITFLPPHYLTSRKKFLFRGETSKHHNPSMRFTEGIKAYGNNTKIWEHAAGDSGQCEKRDSAYISMSANWKVARTYAKGGFVCGISSDECIFTIEDRCFRLVLDAQGHKALHEIPENPGEGFVYILDVPNAICAADHWASETVIADQEWLAVHEIPKERIVGVFKTYEEGFINFQLNPNYSQAENIVGVGIDGFEPNPNYSGRLANLIASAPVEEKRIQYFHHIPADMSTWVTRSVLSFYRNQFYEIIHGFDETNPEHVRLAKQYLALLKPGSCGLTIPSRPYYIEEICHGTNPSAPHFKKMGFELYPATPYGKLTCTVLEDKFGQVLPQTFQYIEETWGEEGFARFRTIKTNTNCLIVYLNYIASTATAEIGDATKTGGTLFHFMGRFQKLARTAGATRLFVQLDPENKQLGRILSRRYSECEPRPLLAVGMGPYDDGDEYFREGNFCIIEIPLSTPAFRKINNKNNTHQSSLTSLTLFAGSKQQDRVLFMPKTMPAAAKKQRYQLFTPTMNSAISSSSHAISTEYQDGVVTKTWQEQGKHVYVRFNVHRTQSNHANLYLFDFKIDNNHPADSLALENAKMTFQHELYKLAGLLGVKKLFVTLSPGNDCVTAFSTNELPLFGAVKLEDLVLRQSQIKLLTAQDIQKSAGKKEYLLAYTEDRKFFVAESTLSSVVFRNGVESRWLLHPELADLKRVYFAGVLETYDGRTVKFGPDTGHYLCHGNHILPLMENVLEKFGLVDVVGKGIDSYTGKAVSAVKPMISYEIKLPSLEPAHMNSRGSVFKLHP